MAPCWQATLAEGFRRVTLNPECIFGISLYAGSAAWLLTVLGCSKPPERLRLPKEHFIVVMMQTTQNFKVITLSQHEVESPPPGAVTHYGLGVL